MPQIETWARLPLSVRDHLIERMRDRKITLEDLNQLRAWIESKPEVPDGLWYKDFGSFKLCGEGKYPKTFLLAGSGRNRRAAVIVPAFIIPGSALNYSINAGTA